MNHISDSVEKLNTLGYSLLTVFTIPATDCFMEIIVADYYVNWRLIIGYIIFAILLPIILTCFLSWAKHKQFIKKYKNGKNRYFEIGISLKKIAFAIVSGLDIVYASLGIEFLMIILILSIRPHKYISEYFMKIGESLVVIIELIVVIIADKKGTGFLSVTNSLIMAISPCIPALAGIYLYYIFDFKHQIEEDEIEEYKKELKKQQEQQENKKEENKEDKIASAGLGVKFASPFLWLFYGICIPVLTQSRDIN